MATKRELTALSNNIIDLPTDDSPIKKTGYTTVDKVHQEDWTAVFVSSKNLAIVFSKVFTKVPLIKLTMSSDGTIPPYKSVVTTTWFSIKYQSSYSGSCDWEATERK